MFLVAYSIDTGLAPWLCCMTLHPGVLGALLALLLVAASKLPSTAFTLGSLLGWSAVGVNLVWFALLVSHRMHVYPIGENLALQGLILLFSLLVVGIAWWRRVATPPPEAREILSANPADLERWQSGRKPGADIGEADAHIQAEANRRDERLRPQGRPPQDGT